MSTDSPGTSPSAAHTSRHLEQQAGLVRLCHNPKSISTSAVTPKERLTCWRGLSFWPRQNTCPALSLDSLVYDIVNAFVMAMEMYPREPLQHEQSPNEVWATTEWHSAEVWQRDRKDSRELHQPLEKSDNLMLAYTSYVCLYRILLTMRKFSSTWTHLRRSVYRLE